MLERTDNAGYPLRPASLLGALRQRTRDLHTRAERSGIIADILHGRATRDGYVLLLQNLLPVYQTLEQQLTKLAWSPLVEPFIRPELERTGLIKNDLQLLSAQTSAASVLPAAAQYVNAIVRASEGDGSRLIAHAYARYLGDLSGGQIVKRLLARSLDLPPAALSFYDFPAISDIAAFKSEYRAAIDRAGDESGDFDAIVEEGALAFQLNIDLSIALQTEAGQARRA
jgi:heme oxygenase (biliverdin-producing, ferredoxin)